MEQSIFLEFYFGAAISLKEGCGALTYYAVLTVVYPTLNMTFLRLFVRDKSTF